MAKTELSRTINKIRTPLNLLNTFLGGGIPFGVAAQFFGATKCGKSTALLQTAEYFLQDYENGHVDIIDSEGNYTTSARLEKVFNLHPSNSVLETVEEDERVSFYRISSIEKAFMKIISLAKESATTKEPRLIIVDSISALSASSVVDEIDKAANKSKDVNVYAGGQAQPLYSKIKTPDGWTTMGEIKIGDKVNDAMGGVTTVTDIFPQGVKDIYRVTFEDGRYTDCCKDHLWKVFYYRWMYTTVKGKNVKFTDNPIYKVIKTEEVLRLLDSKHYKNNLYVPLTAGELTDVDIDLPLDPYLIGALIGDGGLTGDGVKFTSADSFIVEKMKSLAKNYKCDLFSENDSFGYRLSVIKEFRNYDSTKGLTNPIKIGLVELDLMGKYSYEKHIPEKYLNASYNQRVALLNGLMDTDGTVDNKSTISYFTTSEQLAKDVQYLVRSLGGLCKIKIKNRTEKKYFTKGKEVIPRRPIFRLNIRHKTPSIFFSLPRKLERCNDNGQFCETLKLKIKSIELIGQESAQCIMVNSPEHLYVTDDFVVTHNSANASVMTKLLGPLVDDISNSWATVIFINQVTVDRNTYGNPEIAKGG